MSCVISTGFVEAGSFFFPTSTCGIPLQHGTLQVMDFTPSRLVPVKNFYILFGIFFVLLCIVAGVAYWQSQQLESSTPPRFSEAEIPELQGIGESGACNVAVVNLHGELYTYAPTKGEDTSLMNASSTGADPSLTTIAISGDIAQKIETIATFPDIKAIVLDVDSGGGSPVAGEEIARALIGSHMPTVALIRDVGASAAYEAAAGAERIFAHTSSLVGSIGITASYNDYTKYNDKEGITYVPLYVGDYKELGTPYAPLTKEGKQVLMDQLQKSYEAFVTTVATYRKLPYEDVRKLANGLAFDARFALDNHLIDEIGGRDEVRAYLATKIGEPAVLCPNW